MKTHFLLLLTALLIAGCTGCATPGIEEGEERRAYTVAPEQHITEHRSIVLTGDAIERLVKLSEADFERVKALLSGGPAQSMGTWSISVSADVKRDKKQDQKAEATADISPTVDIAP